MKRDQEIDLLKKSEKEARSELQWWDIDGSDEEDDSKIVNGISDQIQNICSHQGFIKQNMFAYAMLYENLKQFVSDYPFYSLPPIVPVGSGNSSLTFNVVASCIDAYTNRLSMALPKPRFITSAGTRRQQKLAKQLTKFVNGTISNSDVRDLSEILIRDAAIFGLGAIHVELKHGQFYFTSVKAAVQIEVDHQDSKSGKPTMMHYRYLESKDKLMAEYPEKAKEIAEVPDHMTTTYSAVQYVEVRKSYHLPSVPGDSNGKYIKSCEGLLLEKEKYEADYFPFLFFRHKDRVEGYFGIGLSEELSYVQYAISKIHTMIQLGQEISCVPRLILESGSVASGYKNLFKAGVLEVKKGARPPVSVSGSAAASDIYRYLEDLYNKAYAISGISQLSAAATPPPGVDSGKAIREYKDAGAQRFVRQAQRLEGVYIHLAKMLVDMASNSSDTIKTFAGGGDLDFLEEIDFKDIDLNNEKFSVDCYPVSMLSDSPSDRLQTVSEMFNLGVIGNDEFLELLNMPDLEKYNSERSASLNLVEKDIEAILDNNELRQPDPLMNLTIAIAVAKAAYLNNLYNSDVSQEQLNTLKQYIDLCIAYLQESQPQQEPQIPVQPNN